MVIPVRNPIMKPFNLLPLLVTLTCRGPLSRRPLLDLFRPCRRYHLPCCVAVLGCVGAFGSAIQRWLGFAIEGAQSEKLTLPLDLRAERR